MGNKFYVPGHEREGRVRDLFGIIAPRYDLINDLQSFWLHRYWKRRLIRLAEVRPGTRALDLCCGTGDVAAGLAREGAEVIGVDFSWPMLEVAQRRRGHRVRWVRGDALRLPFPDGYFDILTISYGLRNLANFKGGLMEFHRVLKSGGRLLVLDFGKPENRLWRGLYFCYLRRAVPMLGKVFCGDSETHGYILESLQHYPGQREVAATMRESGYERVRVVELLGGVMSIAQGENSTKVFAL